MAELKGEMPALVGGDYFDVSPIPVPSGPSGEPIIPTQLEVEIGTESDGSGNDEKSETIVSVNNNGSGDCIELFKRHLMKKTNIYNVNSSIPLSTPWTFWVDRTQPGMGVEEFEASLRKIKTVYSVHVFWGVFYNIPLPSLLHNRSSLHVTRDDRKPIWEEEYNQKGGTFRLRTQKKDTDKVWRELLMATVGEQFDDFVDDKDEVCGISVSIREREDVVLIWNKDVELADKARVFECAHKILPDTHFISETYKPHIAHHSFKKHKIAGYQNGYSQGQDHSQGARTGGSNANSRSHGYGHGTERTNGQGTGGSNANARGHGYGHGTERTNGHGTSGGNTYGYGHGEGYEATRGNGNSRGHSQGYGISEGYGHGRGRGMGNGPARRNNSNESASSTRNYPRSRGWDDYDQGHGQGRGKYNYAAKH